LQAVASSCKQLQAVASSCKQLQAVASSPNIGAVFKSNKELEASVEEMVHNSSIDQLIQNLRKDLASVECNNDHRKSLVEKLSVRFAYLPILHTLQEMDRSLEELVGLSSGAVLKPDYLPEKVTLL
jgi:hypothetical protein